MYLIKITYFDGFSEFCGRCYASSIQAQRAAAELYKRPKTQAVEILVVESQRTLRKLTKSEL
jgi:hypothetical protein